MSVKYWHASTQKSSGAAFLITQACNAKDYLHTERYSLKTSKHEKHTRVTDCPTGCFISIMN
jgi:hypothetical protein